MKANGVAVGHHFHDIFTLMFPPRTFEADVARANLFGFLKALLPGFDVYFASVVSHTG